MLAEIYEWIGIAAMFTACFFWSAPLAGYWMRMYWKARGPNNVGVNASGLNLTVTVAKPEKGKY